MNGIFTCDFVKTYRCLFPRKSLDPSRFTSQIEPCPSRTCVREFMKATTCGAFRDLRLPACKQPLVVMPFFRASSLCSHSYPNPFSRTAIHPLSSSRVTQEAARIHSSPYGKTGFPTKGANNCINLAMDWQEKSLKSTRIACSFLQEKKGGVQHLVPPFSRISRISDFSVPGQEFPSGGNRHRH